MYVTYNDLFTFVLMLIAFTSLILTLKKKHKK